MLTDGQGRIRPELFVTGSAEETPSAFEQLKSAAGEIRTTFGYALDWDSKDGKRDITISAPMLPGSAEEPDDWKDLIPAAVEALDQFHAAVLPHFDSATDPADVTGG